MYAWVRYKTFKRTFYHSIYAVLLDTSSKFLCRILIFFFNKTDLEKYFVPWAVKEICLQENNDHLLSFKWLLLINNWWSLCNWGLWSNEQYVVWVIRFLIISDSKLWTSLRVSHRQLLSWKKVIDCMNQLLRAYNMCTTRKHLRRLACWTVCWNLCHGAGCQCIALTKPSSYFLGPL